MQVFPQLSSGAVTQWPIRRNRVSRTVVNESMDGTRIKLGDSGADSMEWDLQFSAITDSERNALWQLFENCEGRLGSFTFLDPADNLLSWSEKLDEPVWSANALLTISSGIADPEGGTQATRLVNTSGGALRIEQIVDGPARLHYAFSVQARSAAPTPLTVYRQATADLVSSVVDVDSQWKRYLLSGSFTSTDESLVFGLELGAGHTVDVYGMQVEAQTGGSNYKKTFSRSGVYPEARFADDVLSVTADGPNRHSCSVRIFSRL